MWEFTENHRNAFYNAIYLILNYEANENTILERDVEDQLMRYDLTHMPDRYNGYLEIPSDYVPVDNVEILFDFFQNTPYGSIYRPIFSEAKEDKIFFQKPLRY